MSLTTFLENAAIVLSWIVLGSEGKKPLRVILEGILFFAAGMMLRILVTMLLSTATVGIPGLSVVNGLIGAVYICFFTSHRRQTKLLLWCTLFTAIMDMTSLGGELGFLLQNSGLMSDSYPARMISGALLVVLAFMIRSYRFDTFVKIPESGKLLLLFGLAGSAVVTAMEVEVIFSANGGASVTTMFCIFYLAMLLMELAGLRSLHDMCTGQVQLMELQAEKQRYRAEQDMAELTKATIEDLRCIRHDLKNQYSYMQILLKEKRYGELNEYFERQQEHLPAQLNYIDCGNRVMNTVVNMEFSKIRSRNLTLEHQLVVPPVLKISDEDLCSLIVNLLDNAAEECALLLQKGTEDVRIRLEIHPHSSYLLIRCENSTDKTALLMSGSSIRTTKPDEESHGYGTKIISRIAEKYNGKADFHLENGKFVALVMLDMMMEG